MVTSCYKGPDTCFAIQLLRMASTTCLLGANRVEIEKKQVESDAGIPQTEADGVPVCHLAKEPQQAPRDQVDS